MCLILLEMLIYGFEELKVAYFIINVIKYFKDIIINCEKDTYIKPTLH